MGFLAYLLRCADDSYYAGHTDNLKLRFGEHQMGACGGYTATRLPVELVWSQEFVTREEALGSEQQIKGWSRKKKEALIRSDWGEINRLGRGKHKHERAITHPSTSGAALPTLPSTSEAAPPTLRTNGGDVAGNYGLQTTPSVRPERSAAKSKDE